MALRKAKLFRCLSISAKNNNKVFRIENNEVFTEDQINNFDEMLACEAIQLVEEEPKPETEPKPGAPASEPIAPVKPLSKSKKK